MSRHPLREPDAPAGAAEDRADAAGGAAGDTTEPGSAKGRERRAQILDRMIRMIADRGVDASSLRSLAEALGISHTALRHYFSSRDELLIAVYREHSLRRPSLAAGRGTAVEQLRDGAVRNRSVPGLVELYTTESDRRAIDSPAAWLVTVTTRICLDVLGSARARRERYVGEWLPEPVPAEARWTSQSAQRRAGDPADRVSLDESLSMALLVVLESMTPAERVAFVLHDVFRYTFAEVGEIVGRSPEACRKLASSARRRVRESRGAAVSAEEHARVVAEFHAALESGDASALVGVLDPDAAAVADGGGRASAVLEPIVGAGPIARQLLDLFGLQPDLAFRVASVNGRAGLVGTDAAGRLLSVLSFAVRDGRVARIWAIRNPDKLAAWSEGDAQR